MYEPPIEEFAIATAEVAAGTQYTFGGVNGPSIFLVYEGSGEVEGDGGFPLASGSVVFVAANTELSVKATAGGLKIARCVCLCVRQSALVPRERRVTIHYALATLVTAVGA